MNGRLYRNIARVSMLLLLLLVLGAGSGIAGTSPQEQGYIKIPVVLPIAVEYVHQDHGMNSELVDGDTTHNPATAVTVAYVSITPAASDRIEVPPVIR